MRIKLLREIGGMPIKLLREIGSMRIKLKYHNTETEEWFARISFTVGVRVLILFKINYAVTTLAIIIIIINGASVPSPYYDVSTASIFYQSRRVSARVSVCNKNPDSCLSCTQIFYHPLQDKE